MSPVAHIHKGMQRVFPGNPLDLLRRIVQRVTIVGTAVHGHGTDKPATATGGRQTDFTDEARYVRYPE